MIGMGKEVGRELVVVPDETVLDVVADGLEVDFREIGIEHKAVEELHTYVDTKGFYSSLPGVFLLVQGVVVGIDAALFGSHSLSEIVGSHAVHGIGICGGRRSGSECQQKDGEVSSFHTLTWL